MTLLQGRVRDGLRIAGLPLDLGAEEAIDGSYKVFSSLKLGGQGGDGSGTLVERCGLTPC
jgi:hypothetical protein